MKKLVVLLVIWSLIAISLACRLPLIGSNELDPPKGSKGPSAELYENIERISLNMEDRTNFIDRFYPEANGYEASTNFGWTMDTATEIHRSLEKKLIDSDRWRVKDDWIFYEQDGLEPQKSIWKYGDLLLGILLIDNLDSKAISQLGKHFGLNQMEPGGTLIVMHMWDTARIAPTPTNTATLIPSDTPIPTDTLVPTLTWTPMPSPTIGPTKTPAMVSEGGWSVVGPGLPAQFELEFSGLVQCREDEDATRPVQEYFGVVAVRYLPLNTWVESGSADLIVETANGFELGRYDIYFQAPADSMVWLIPRDVGYGGTIKTGDSKASVFKLMFKELNEQAATVSRSNFQYEAQVVDRGVYGNPDFPQNRFLVVVNNLGDLAMNDAYLFGLVKDSKGNTVDILTTEREIDIPFGGSQQYELYSMSNTGRCVGPADPQGYVLHYWLVFEAADRQLISDYFTLPVK